ncbi:hypothetical protein HOY82DRAFT_83752 [Tuber indicum]|nr:hypothetical protein HOY82DRAFT_83752 [Tuber indicum]
MYERHGMTAELQGDHSGKCEGIDRKPLWAGVFAMCFLCLGGLRRKFSKLFCFALESDGAGWTSVMNEMMFWVRFSGNLQLLPFFPHAFLVNTVVKITKLQATAVISTLPHYFFTSPSPHSSAARRTTIRISTFTSLQIYFSLIVPPIPSHLSSHLK